jgi:hypothetical protein
MKKSGKPFGLEFLTEVDMRTVNGGRHHRKHHHGGSTPPPPAPPAPPSPPVGPGGGTVHTMAVSMPQPAFPSGDSF